MKIWRKKRYPVFCFLLVCVFTLTTVHPFVRVDAAELWNSQSKGRKSSSDSKKRYYNQQRSSPRKSAEEQTPLLFNSQRNSRRAERRSLSGGKLVRNVRRVETVTVGTQKSSKLWGYLAPSAVENRQNDIDHALQIEYGIRQKNAATQAKSAQLRSRSRTLNAREHEEKIAQYRKKEAATEAAKEARKRRALEGRGGARRSSRSSGAVGTSVQRQDLGLQRPRRLFNDPNR